MARNWHKLLVWLMWPALPVVAWMYWSAWDQLPARMAVHFDANWQPNGYTSREGALLLGLGILFVLLVLFTVATLIIDTMKPPVFWPALVISYGVLSVCVYGNHMIVKFALRPKPQLWELHSRAKAIPSSQYQQLRQPIQTEN